MPAKGSTHAEAGDTAAGRGRRRGLWLLAAAALLLAAAAGAAYWYYWLRQPPLPPGFASGNGRVEATEYDIATKRAGRVEEVHAHEGDLVEKGQVLAQMDIDELTAQRHEAEAELARARKAEATAKAVLVQRAPSRSPSSTRCSTGRRSAARSSARGWI
jgi:HlyD family secretion protein